MTNKLHLVEKARAVFDFLTIMTNYCEYRPCSDYWYRKLNEWSN